MRGAVADPEISVELRLSGRPRPCGRRHGDRDRSATCRRSRCCAPPSADAMPGRGAIAGAPFWSEAPFFVNRLGIPPSIARPATSATATRSRSMSSRGISRRHRRLRQVHGPLLRHRRNEQLNHRKSNKGNRKMLMKTLLTAALLTGALDAPAAAHAQTVGPGGEKATPSAEIKLTDAEVARAEGQGLHGGPALAHLVGLRQRGHGRRQGRIAKRSASRCRDNRCRLRAARQRATSRR